MTEGEKQVWAAVFAKEYNISSPPGHVLKDHCEWDHWERRQAVNAIECATGAVDLLRRAKEDVAEGFGTDSDVYMMLEEMLR